MRILLAEDEPDLGKAVKRVLNQEGYVVDWAQSGNEALGFLEQDASIYEVGVFDWMLPEITGIELCQWLRRRSIALPVLMLTAKDKIEDRITGHAQTLLELLLHPGWVQCSTKKRGEIAKYGEFRPKFCVVNAFLT